MTVLGRSVLALSLLAVFGAAQAHPPFSDDAMSGPRPGSTPVWGNPTEMPEVYLRSSLTPPSRPMEPLVIRIQADAIACRARWGEQWQKRCVNRVRADNPNPVISVTRGLKGSWAWKDDETLVFTPEQSWHGGDLVTVSLQGFTMPKGTALVPWDLDVRLPDLVVVSRDVKAGRDAVTLDLRFNLAARSTAFLEEGFRYRASNTSFGTPVFTWSEDNSRVQIRLPVLHAPKAGCTVSMEMSEVADRVILMAGRPFVPKGAETARFQAQVPAAE